MLCIICTNLQDLKYCAKYAQNFRISCIGQNMHMLFLLRGSEIFSVSPTIKRIIRHLQCFSYYQEDQIFRVSPNIGDREIFSCSPNIKRTRDLSVFLLLLIGSDIQCFSSYYQEDQYRTWYVVQNTHMFLQDFMGCAKDALRYRRSKIVQKLGGKLFKD